MSQDQHTGIAGLEGTTSVGVALTVGCKGDRGFPVDRDRFYLVWPQEDEAGRRPPHPRFGAFNKAEPKHRRAIFGTIAHVKQADCFTACLRNQAVKGAQNPPSMRPFCTGNGVRALRYKGLDANQREQFEDIVCPHDACEFRQRKVDAKGNDYVECKPHLTFLFMLQWQAGVDMPSMLCKYTSGAWSTTKAFVGFFHQVYAMGSAFGLDPGQINLAGLRFVIQLSERKNRARKSRYPTVSITLVDDLAEFFTRQTRRALEISGRRPVAALTDEHHRDPVVQANDWAAHEPVSVLDISHDTTGEE